MVLSVGYTAFEAPSESQENCALGVAQAYLQTVSERAVSEVNRAIDFNIHIGNYYQTYSWLRDGSLDAALVSPFVATVLGKGRFIRLKTFREHAVRPEARGHTPSIASSRNVGRPGYNPNDDYDSYLSKLL